MSRLIDADALMASVEGDRDFYKDMYDKMHQPCEQDERAIVGASYTAYGKCYHRIRTAPTIDAVEVVHGEWIRTDDNICYARICSKCRKHVRVCIGLRCHDCDTEANYCPNCGAKMDGEVKNDEQID